MILFNHMRLAEQLGRGELTETIKFYYYLILLVLYSTFGSNPPLTLLYTNDELSIYDQAYITIPSILTITAAVIAFRLNASGDNHDFLARIICLGVPLWIQAKLLSIFIYFIIVFMRRRLQVPILELSEATDGIDLAIITAVTLYYGGQYIRGIYRAAMQSNSSSSKPT